MKNTKLEPLEKGNLKLILAEFAKFLQEYKPKHYTTTFSSTSLDEKKTVDVEIIVQVSH